MILSEEQLKRFWSRVNKTETCWLWTGSKVKGGYGQLELQGKRQLAHIVSYRLANADYDKAKCVCHKCDIPSCVNPEHLFLATQSENMKDCVAKGRGGFGNGLKGEEIKHSKLKEQEVIDIKRRLKQGESTKEILKIHNKVSRSAIEDIKHQRTWKHIL
jgi:hypothetical protein